MSKNVNIVIGEFEIICKEIKKESLNAILTNLSTDHHEKLKTIASSGILKEGGFCTTFKDHNNFEETVKTRTPDNAVILVILGPHKDKIVESCRKMEGRSFTIIRLFHAI